MNKCRALRMKGRLAYISHLDLARGEQNDFIVRGLYAIRYPYIYY